MSQHLYEYNFLFSLIFTIIVETVVLFLIIRLYLKIDKHRLPNNLLIFCGIFCSFATLPYLWFVLPIFLGSHTNYMIFGELSVTLSESIILYFILRLDRKTSLIISTLCNFISFILGLLLLSPLLQNLWR